MGFLDKPMRYFPLQKEYANCDVCGCHTLLLIPCSHWHCSNCGYDTRISDYKLSKLKNEYKEVRELNQKAHQKQYDLEREKRISKWVKCVDCKYYEYVDAEDNYDCKLPPHCDRRDDQIHTGRFSDDNYKDGFRYDIISCSWGEKKKLNKVKVEG